MNFKKTAKQLEQFLDEELSKNPPIAILKDGSFAFHEFIIKKDQTEAWSLKRPGGCILDTFNLKSSALTAAYLHHRNNFKTYTELKILDDTFFKNSTDADRYKHRWTSTKDIELRDFFISRYIEAKNKADYARTEITKRFRSLF